ncbi:MAG TPA: hypothetical protein VNO32_28170, partial [Candidatus Acidoferrum sp.]|nr:hypothetical protein [Candidatus Acidoferrum sp.]
FTVPIAARTATPVAAVLTNDLRLILFIISTVPPISCRRTGHALIVADVIRPSENDRMLRVPVWTSTGVSNAHAGMPPPGTPSRNPAPMLHKERRTPWKYAGRGWAADRPSIFRY